MPNILALIEFSHRGDIAGSARGLLAAAARLGTPVAVVASAAPLEDDVVARLGQLGAVHVYSAVVPSADAVLVAPALEALGSAVAALKRRGSEGIIYN